MKKTIAAFDFDGTITVRDILLPFMDQVFGKWKVGCAVATLLPSLFQFGMGLKNRQQVKEQFLSWLIKGMPLSHFCRLADLFASETLPGMLRQNAIERILWHKNQGHHVVLISANLMPLLTAFTQTYGLDQPLASKLAIDKESALTGKLQGLNCWGEEKRARLIEAYGPKENYTLYAYGDSRGDKELLQLADYPYYRYF